MYAAEMATTKIVAGKNHAQTTRKPMKISACFICIIAARIRGWTFQQQIRDDERSASAITSKKLIVRQRRARPRHHS